MLQRFDELDNLETALREILAEAIASGERPHINADRCVDDIFDILLICWAMGNNDAAEVIGETEVPIQKVVEDIYHEIDGLTFADRARSHIAEGNIEMLITLIETEATHDYNSGVLTTGLESGLPLMKRWNTQLDDRVRDTHSYLESTVVPIDADFYTYDGDHAPYPTGFEYAENNVNCRCYLTLEPMANPTTD